MENIIPKYSLPLENLPKPVAYPISLSTKLQKPTPG